MRTEPGPQITFVIPLHFTGGGVRELFGAFRGLEVEGGHELVLVNDGSTDETMRLVREAMAASKVEVTVVDMARNYGEHAAVLEGMRHARGTYVVNLDDDLQNPVSQALQLVECLRATDADVVYSSYEKKQHHWFRNLGSWFTNRVATFLLGKPKDLYLSSFRAMKSELAARLTRYAGPYPYVDGLILEATNRIATLKVDHQPRNRGRSGYTLRKLLELWANMFFNFSIMPLRVASVLGVVLCLLGALLFVEVLVERLIFGVGQVGWSSLMAAVSFFSGSQLLILGLMGEYLGRAYMTVSGKPQSLVREVIRHVPEKREYKGGPRT